MQDSVFLFLFAIATMSYNRSLSNSQALSDGWITELESAAYLG